MVSGPSPASEKLSSEQSEETRSGKDLWIALLACALCLLAYNANGRLIGAGDTYPARYLPFGLLRYHTPLLDPISTIAAQGRSIGVPPGHKPPRDEWRFKAFWMEWTGEGHQISLYPVAIPVLLTPLYAPAVQYLNWKGWDQWRFDSVARIMEKLSASLIAAVSAGLMYLLLRRRASPNVSLLLTFAYALGTTTWMIGSQALWQHGMTELLLVGILLAVTSPCTSRAVAVAGVLCGLVVCNRPPDGILAAAIGLYGLRWAGRKAPLLVGAALLPMLLLLAYNFRFAGHWAGGYGLAGTREFFGFNPLTGAMGLLFSPARGLFVYAPFLLFIPLFARRVWREHRTRFLTVAMSISIVLLVATYAKTDWRQGACWGPRWLTSALPMLVWMLPPIVNTLSRAGRTAFIAACLAGVAVEAIGAFWYTGTSDASIYAIQNGPHATRAAWDPRNAPFWTELQHPAAPADVATAVRGSLDVAVTNGGGDLRLANGKAIGLEGWALASGFTPSEVVITLDGRVIASTHEFFLRPDVTKALGVPFASGWRIRIAARRLDEGDHLLAVFVRAVDGGQTFFLVDRKFVVPDTADLVPESLLAVGAAPQTLPERARQAASFIASHQDVEGYWLTSYTKAPKYQRSRLEMTTFTNAILIDLLTPVAKQAHLEGNMTSARRFLTAQIEDGGLVRYHGRPDSPFIGTLGCAITPDADDTALAWRIAPALDRSQLARALETLRSYRTPEGLYRTWLSPMERYQCLDPGANPNPVDAGIQMHVFLLLATEDPPGAGAVCRALGQRTANDDVWVYYRIAPILPILRQADLYNLGCNVDLPPSLSDHAGEGQKAWIAVAKFLQRFMRHGGSPPVQVEVERLLDTLSRDNFALVRRSPPLLYHNDLTATVPRFYWSEDVGYALWLRLYAESQRALGRTGTN